MTRLSIKDIQARYGLAASLAHAFACNGHFGPGRGTPQKYDADTVDTYITKRRSAQRAGKGHET